MLVEYRDDPSIKHIFNKAPYITQHMSAKDRNEYTQFKKGKNDFKPPQAPTMPSPAGFGMYGPIPQNYNYMPPMGRQPQPMGGFGLPYSSMP